MAKKKTYPRIEFDSWNSQFYIVSKPSSIGRMIKPNTALKLAKTKKYFFVMTGFRDKGYSTKVYSKQKCYEQVKYWV